MSDLAVRVERIVKVEKHPNADRLDLVQVLDWHCVAQKDSFKEGDLAVYIPIDSILPEKFEQFIFGPDSKIQLSKHRVKTIRLRGAISQGLLLDLPGVSQYLGKSREYIWIEGDNLTPNLGVTKYEPPVRFNSQFGTAKSTAKRPNPYFHKYTSIQNAKNYPGVFREGDPVVITEKIHGTNFRAGYVPFHASTWWKKIKQWLGFAPAYEFVYGSHNVQLHDGSNKVYYDKNVYAKIVEQYNLKAALREDEVIYGEIYGDGIQKGYTYGLSNGDHKLAVFDVMIEGKYAPAGDLEHLCEEIGVPSVPLLYKGPWNEQLKGQVIGDSKIGGQKVKEGIVVKPYEEDTHPMLGRKVLKFISDEYLLKDNSDFH